MDSFFSDIPLERIFERVSEAAEINFMLCDLSLIKRKRRELQSYITTEKSMPLTSILELLKTYYHLELKFEEGVFAFYATKK